MVRLAWLILALWGGLAFCQKSKPNIVIITVDTLRADHMGSYGYGRNTSPHIDHLLAKGIRFSQARTIEPLTAPALCSMITGIYPHNHGASRNGLPLFPNLISMTKLLGLEGYRTAGFVANWTLRNKLTGLKEHFNDYEEVFTRKRWFGLFLSESNANDVTKSASQWLSKNHDKQPFLLWVHYVEPHAPYRFHKEHATQVGLQPEGSHNKKDRYDTEIAFVDHSIGVLLKKIKSVSPDENTLFVFASDHGESLGEHNYWGHGRHLYEPTLHIPMGITWQGVLKPGVVDAPATIMDIPATLLGLTGLSVPPSFDGLDWAPVFTGAQKAAMDRITFFQAHKGAVQTKAGITKGRQRGLLEVAVLQNNVKEILNLRNMKRSVFDLGSDREEIKNLSPKNGQLSESIEQWALAVERGLNIAMNRQPQLDQSDLEKLRSLGYID